MKRRRKLTKTDQEILERAKEFLASATDEEVERLRRTVQRLKRKMVKEKAARSV